MDGYFLTINGHDFFLQKLYGFEDTFVLECLRKKTKTISFERCSQVFVILYKKRLITIQNLNVPRMV